MTKITVQKTDVTILKINEDDYISLTDIAKFKTSDPFVVCNCYVPPFLRKVKNRINI
jgi:hypothetical protein